MRHFDIGGSPQELAVSLEDSQKVGVIQWNKHNGTPGKLLAEATLDGNVPAAIWAN